MSPVSSLYTVLQLIKVIGTQDMLRRELPSEQEECAPTICLTEILTLPRLPSLFPIFQYIIDVYQTGSASALASLTFTRYIVSGGAVMFTTPMYRSLGTHWALSLLAFLSLVFSFIPWLFYFFGKRVRTWSRYTPPVEDE